MDFRFSTQGSQDASSSRLPVEVCENIIDFLDPYEKDERFALLQCCLTCRSWLPRSRLNLYRVVDFPPETHSAIALLNILAKSSHLRGLIHRIFYHVQLGLRNDRQIVATAASYQATFLRAPRLTLALREMLMCNIPVLHSSTFTRVRGQFKSVTTLRLRATEFVSFSDLRKLIMAYFPNLETLTLSEIHWKSQYIQHIPSNPRYTELHLTSLTLHIDDGQRQTIDVITTWILATNTRLTLRILDIQHVGAGGAWYPYLQLMQGCTELRKLVVRGFYGSHRDHEVDLTLGPEILPKVEELEFAEIENSALGLFCSLISRSSPPRLSAVRISISEQLGDTTSKDWALLDSTFSSPVFRGLRKVYATGSFVPWSFPELRNLLPHLHDKGILKPWSDD